MTRAGWLVLLFGCGPAPEEVAAIPLPEGFPPMTFPDDNVPTAEKIELGRHLFYDPRLSGNGEQSCASCHEQARAFTDGRVVPLGSTGESLPRNSPSLTNTGYNATLTWANPTLTSLEVQILIPLFGDAPIELGADETSLARITGDPAYIELFDAAYPASPRPAGTRWSRRSRRSTARW
jgi:cytochrome c peroxidase